ncbi:MAG: hypothetical protein DSZ23_01435 [Thermodesulfatator sp.]|nr:MAG: hypothetical protein DSZ23_01435 [Thermodesulfatator sp.]
MKKRILFCLILTLFFVGPLDTFAQPAPGNEASNSTAVPLVEGLHELLLQSMKAGESMTCSQRYERLEPYILKAFDFPLICRIVLGRHWKELDKAKREEFIKVFSRMTVATYASRFDAWSGESFKTIYAGMDKKGHFRVETFLVKKNGEKISLDYACRRSGDDWKIVSVSARGVNDLSVKRAAYASYLKEHSIDELMAKLEKYAKKCLENSEKRK